MPVPLLVLYLGTGLLFAAVGLLVGFGHSPYPDCRIGYHHALAMRDRASWEFVNRTTGILCGLAACLLGIAALLLAAFQAGKLLPLACYFLLVIPSLLLILLLPLRLQRGRDRAAASLSRQKGDLS